MKKFFISDTHFGDERLNLYGRDRLFKSAEEVDNTIIDNWNKIVTDDDLIIHLGDVALTEEGFHKLGRCNGKKILVIGNYDDNNQTAKFNVTDELLKKYFFKVITNGFITIGDEKVYLTHKPTDGKDDYFNLVGHIHGTWKVQRNMLNLGVDAWNYIPVSEETVSFQINGIRNHYDENVFAGELEVNIDKANKKENNVK